VGADFALFIIFVAALLVGILRGSVRQLIAFGAWLVTFVLAAHLRPPVGAWIMEQSPQYSDAYALMLAFLLVFMVAFLVALVLIETIGASLRLTNRAVIDEVLGGVLLLGVAVLVVSSVLIALDSYYAHPVPGAPELDFINSIHNELQESVIADALRKTVVPVILTLLGPLLPADVRAVV
jgi:uncharacterized membrane protein required for colicin V production